MENKTISFFEYVLRFLFPPRCVCCDCLLSIQTPVELCSVCRDNLPILQKREHLNHNGNSIGKIYCAFDYDGGIRKAIHHLKFSYKPGNAAALIDLSYPYLERFLSSGGTSFMTLPDYDIIVSVPMHHRRKRKRGYNQSELLAYRLAKYMGVPHSGRVMVKEVNTPAQSTLGKGGRFRNLIGVFRVKAFDLIKEKKVLLVDDVMTTGSTLEQCGRALIEAGALKVDAFVVAMGKKVIR